MNCFDNPAIEMSSETSTQQAMKETTERTEAKEKEATASNPTATASSGARFLHIHITSPVPFFEERKFARRALIEAVNDGARSTKRGTYRWYNLTIRQPRKLQATLKFNHSQVKITEPLWQFHKLTHVFFRIVRIVTTLSVNTIWSKTCIVHYSFLICKSVFRS